MAFASTVNWDVRSTGSDSNGGGFDPTSGVPGTDYSQQDSPQVTYTDLVIDGTTNTKCTSAAHPFTSAHVGNIINVTGGTGFTVQRVQVMSVSVGVATCDKSLGTLSSTGGTGNLGGGLATLATAAGLLVASNKVWVKSSGTYTLTSAVTLNSVTQKWEGYSSTHGDLGTKPSITTATNSTQLFLCPGSSNSFFTNFSLSNTAGTRGDAFRASSNYPSLYLSKCVLDGFNKGINGDNGSSTWVFDFISVVGTEIKNCVTFGIGSYYGIHVFGCYIHDNTQDGIQNLGSANTSIAVSRTIFANNGRYAIVPTTAGTISVDNCVFYKNGLTYSGHPYPQILGNSSGAFMLIANSIFYGCAAAGNIDDGHVLAIGRNNASDIGMLVGTTTSTYSGVGDLTITVDPFTNAAGGDFSLNSTAGGGLVCKLAGFQWSGSFLDIGPIQTSGGAAGAMLVHTGMSGGMRG